MSIIQEPTPTLAPPCQHVGDAQVTYQLGILRFHVAGWRWPMACTAIQWLELSEAVSAALNGAAMQPDPQPDMLAESRQVAARVASLGEGGGVQ